MADRALSIRQPWAWAVIYGGKIIENRDWSTGHVGRLLIHASKTFDEAGYEFLCEAVADGDLTLARPLPSPSEFLRGGIIGEVTMQGCIHSPGELDEDEWLWLAAHLSDDLTDLAEAWWRGPVGWVVTHPEPHRFRPCRGMPGLFRPGVAATDG